MLERNPQYWRERAEEYRVVADSVVDPIAKEMMKAIADGYTRHAIAREIGEADYHLHAVGLDVVDDLRPSAPKMSIVKSS